MDAITAIPGSGSPELQGRFYLESGNYRGAVGGCCDYGFAHSLGCPKDERVKCVGNIVMKMTAVMYNAGPVIDFRSFKKAVSEPFMLVGGHTIR